MVDPQIVYTEDFTEREVSNIESPRVKTEQIYKIMWRSFIFRLYKAKVRKTINIYKLVKTMPLLFASFYNLVNIPSINHRMLFCNNI